MVTQSPAKTRAAEAERGLVKAAGAGPRYGGRRAFREEPAAIEIVFQEAPDRPARRDSLPEYTRYIDTGCDLHPSCLTCPLVRCRYDEPAGRRSMATRERDGSILRLRRDQRLTIEAIAKRFGLSRRTVFRVLARAREGEAKPW